MKLSGTSQRRLPRPSLWVAASYLVLAVGVIALFAVATFGYRALALSGSTIQLEAEWTGAYSDAVLHLHEYALTGDPEAWAGYEQALTLPRGLREPLRIAARDPSDGNSLREALASHPDLAERLAYWPDFQDRFGSLPEVMVAANIRVLRDDLLLQIEELALALDEAVATSGAGSEPVLDVTEAIRTLNLELNAISDPFWAGIMAWGTARREEISRYILYTSILLLLGGILVIGAAVIRARRDENVLIESEGRFRQIAEHINGVFWLTSLDKGRMLYVSPAYETVWERTREALYQDPAAWLEAVVPEDRRRVEAAIAGQQSGEYDVEYRITTPDGDTRWIRDRAFVVRDSEDLPVRIAGIAEDVTARRRLEQEVLEAKRLKSIGSLAGGVAHDFNNLLTVAQGHIQLLRSDLESRPELTADLDSAAQALTRAAALTRNLLSYSGRQILFPRDVDLSAFLDEATGRVRDLLAPDVELSVKAETKVHVRADPTHLMEVLTTLVNFSLSTMSSGGRLNLETVTIGRDEPIQVRGGHLKPGRWAGLVVEDTGRGITRSELAHLFEPFPAIGSPESPIRLGMAAAYGLVEQLGGGIRVESLEGIGTRFTVILPESDSADMTALAVSPELTATSGERPPGAAVDPDPG